MKRITAIYFLLISAFATITSSCKQNTKTSFKKDNSAFFDLGGSQTLTIAAHFSECGEWGGHKETMAVYADDKNNMHAHYQKYPVNCDSITLENYRSRLKPLTDKELILDHSNEAAISNYLKKLTQSKIEERSFSNAGNSFSAFTSDSTFFIEVSGNNPADAEHYSQLINELFNDDMVSVNRKLQ